MEQLEITSMSSRGQVVIPQKMRKKLNLHEGEKFVVIGEDDTILLKKVAAPSPKEIFTKVHKWGIAFAKRKGLDESDLQTAIKRSRGL